VRDPGRLDRPDLLKLDLGAPEVVEEASAMFSSVSSMIRVLSFTSPPYLSCDSRQAASERAQSCSRSPPSPSGFSLLWFGPATNPSAEIEM
jgi:hypothetical protein